MTNIEFKSVEPVDSIKEVIKEVFDVELDILGGWGYSDKSTLIMKNTNVPKEQFMHMFATMRANIEMNLTLEDDDRYGAINLTLETTKETKIDNKTYTVANFKITAINEKVYASFIQ
ncbi:MAG: hypothetical protein DRG78_09645, partial [Epsilonproteobacteria bacterium]